MATRKKSTTGPSAGSKQPAAAPKEVARHRHWLMKTDPESFSFDDLWRAPRRRTTWDGVRNHQARNTLRDAMRTGDLVLLYHSRAEPPGVVGIARIAGAAKPDASQFDPKDEHFDPKARPDDPTWYAIDVQALAPVKRFVSLDELKQDPRLARMLVVQRGQRLSVQAVEPGEWSAVLELAGLDPQEFSPA